ncbi:MAG TPA: hypothetical protein VGJ59_12095 [Jatrophihabitantaceae bacterium]|jgi:hypothetical protein
MKRLLIYSAAAAAIAAAGIPAVAGLAGNPSFSHKLPVRPPSQAQLVEFDDHGRAVRSTPPTARESEPGDDRGGAGTSAPEPGDDRGGAGTHAPEPGDDSGGHRGGTGPGRGR